MANLRPRPICGKRSLLEEPVTTRLVKRTKISIPTDKQAEVIIDAGTQFDGVSTGLQPFRLMDLPAEIRIEIYRACLTRPFDILLSKPEQKPDSLGLDQDTSAVSNITVYTSDEQSVIRVPSTRRCFRVQHARATPRTGSCSSSIAERRVSSQRILPAARQRQPNQMPTHQARLVEISDRGKRVPGYDARAQTADPLLVNLLQASKLIYKEARPVLYGENSFHLDIITALSSLAALHQRSRGQIRFLHLTIPTHSEILERFAEVVRLSLRYCWRLQVFTVNMPFALPGTDGNGLSNTTVYANAFDILRWLPKQCKVVLEGNVSDDIRKVVQRNANLAKNLDELAYARRQLISYETSNR